MKKLRILNNVLKKTKANEIILSFVLFVLISALIIMLVEPSINSYGDALWYCYAVITTVGFGDIVIATPVGKIVSVLLSIYAVFVIAVATGVVVSYYNQCIQMQYKDSVYAALDRLERLPELSKEELSEISERVKQMR